jgi:hypothetical protein
MRAMSSLLRSELHRYHRLGDQLRCIRPMMCTAEDAIGVGVGEHLHEPGGLTQRTRARH